MTFAISGLLIEDNLLDAQLFVTLVNAPGSEALTLHHSSTVAEAIAELSHTQFDIILLNLSFFATEGTDLLQQIKGCAPSVPIVVLAADRTTSAVAALQAGAQDCLIKPWVRSQGHLSQSTRVAVGNLLITTLRNTVLRAQIARQLAISQERCALAQRQVQQLAWQAAHDPLTRLSNRASFEQVLDSLLEDRRSPGISHVLCYLDLDHFKVINDTCGHAAGDQLLKQISALWLSQIRASDVLARLGGDEFGLLLNSCSIERARQIAEALCESVHDFRFSYDGNFFKIGVSIGIAAMTADIGGREELIKLADFACYQAKERGRGHIYVHDASAHKPYCSMDEDWHCPSSGSAAGSIAESMVGTEAQSVSETLPFQLAQAFDTNQFQLYQEVIAPTDTANVKVEHREVLIRLRNRQSGQLMPPMGFIPTAERYKLMPQIDRWVLQQVICHVAKASQATSADFDHLKYSINLSADSLSDDSFVEFLQQQLNHQKTPASSLCFEITETAAIANIQKTINFTTALKSLGCQVALDNFGSSISSLTSLKQLPLDYLKIDGRFVKEAVLDSVTFTMLAAIQQVAQVMQIKTVAKCVESKSIRETVKTIGLDFVQGYEIGMSESLGLVATPSFCPQGQPSSLPTRC